MTSLALGVVHRLGIGENLEEARDFCTADWKAIRSVTEDQSRVTAAVFRWAIGAMSKSDAASQVEMDAGLDRNNVLDGLNGLFNALLDGKWQKEKVEIECSFRPDDGCVRLRLSPVTIGGSETKLIEREEFQKVLNMAERVLGGAEFADDSRRTTTHALLECMKPRSGDVAVEELQLHCSRAGQTLACVRWEDGVLVEYFGRITSYD
jgi:hypothetical protein